ncbi:hypothetical protein ILUMI_12806 [Ignelater luminosus]|uniref:Uncharacterized protein n=1 Tax=Ignelater luminosus TaxID=2038154 RepID=A0A8K0D229_IGNLU|nr:hypothetical protein ILUMI_12806 [Ignelater luminosus]
MRAYLHNLEQSLVGIPSTNISKYDKINLTDQLDTKTCIFSHGTKYLEIILDSTNTAISLVFAATVDSKSLPPYVGVVYKTERMGGTLMGLDILGTIAPNQAGSIGDVDEKIQRKNMESNQSESTRTSNPKRRRKMTNIDKENKELLLTPEVLEDVIQEEDFIAVRFETKKTIKLYCNSFGDQ